MTSTPKTGTSRLVTGGVCVFALTLGYFTFSAFGCSDSSTTDPKIVTVQPDKPDGSVTTVCDGGVLVDGGCVATCDPSKCVDGNLCVDNACRLVCTTDGDCAAGQRCQAVGSATLDGDADLKKVAETFGVCLTTTNRQSASGGLGSYCPMGDECTAYSCPNGRECDPQACGGDPSKCVADPTVCGDDANCNVGKCSDSGADCLVTTCDSAQCSQLTCMSFGEGDADAYCTLVDCTSDDVCGPGFHCGHRKDPRKLCTLIDTCGTNGRCENNFFIECNGDSDCAIGADSFCGATADPCVDPANLTATLTQGEHCIWQTACAKSAMCSECTTHLDCPGHGDLCATVGSGKFCGTPCTDSASCGPAKVCVSAGKACSLVKSDCTTADDCPKLPCLNGYCLGSSKSCSTNDDCSQSCDDGKVCIPGSDSLQTCGGGTVQFCSYCQDDTDCGGDYPYCRIPVDGVGGCFDLSYASACPNGTDDECPSAPDGTHGTCIVNAGSVFDHKCSMPAFPSSGAYTCWVTSP